MRQRSNEDLQNNPRVRMFAEDVSLGIMPIRGQSDLVPDFTVELRGSSEYESRANAILKSLVMHKGYSLEELLSGAVDMIAHGLVWNGLVVYRITTDKNYRGVGLSPGLAPRHSFRVFGRSIQITPKAERDPQQKLFAIIPKKDIWEIAMPKTLGGRRGHRAMLKCLEQSQAPVPLFVTSELSEQELPAYFSSQHYAKEREFCETKITARWGWDRQDLSLRNWTEFYAMYRHLTLKWAQACLREHIVKELNQLLQRLHINAEIVVKGLPTQREILVVRQQMCEGKVSLAEAFDACSV